MWDPERPTRDGLCAIAHALALMRDDTPRKSELTFLCCSWSGREQSRRAYCVRRYDPILSRMSSALRIRSRASMRSRSHCALSRSARRRTATMTVSDFAIGRIRCPPARAALSAEPSLHRALTRTGPLLQCFGANARPIRNASSVPAGANPHQNSQLDMTGLTPKASAG